MKFKKALALVLALAMVATVLFAVPVSAKKTNLEVGDKVYIGTYEGEPVEYTVYGSADANGDGVEELFLSTSKIISFKEFNTGNYFTNWKYTNKLNPPAIRKWLNSTETSINYKVNGETANPSYASQPGFMTGMSALELGQIVPVTHKSKMNATELSTNTPDGGSSNFMGGEGDWPGYYTNSKEAYDAGYYVETTDSVFLPSMEEAYAYMGGLDVGATDTAILEAIALGDESLYQNSKQQFRDTLDPRSGESRSFKWYQGNKVLNSSLVTVAYGIRPSLWLKGDTEIKLASGSSTENPVYQIKAPEKTGLAVGDLIQIGTYKGEPVEYKVYGTKDVDGDGKKDFFLSTSQIISFKEFNTGSYYTNWKYTNKLNPSAIRKWLNSNEETINYKVNGETANPSYASQPGFMTGMSNIELKQIIPVTNKSKMNATELTSNAPDGGSSNFMGGDGDWPGYYTNSKAAYDAGYYVETTDSVFLPSMEEAAEYMGSLDVGATEIAKAEAVAVGDTSLYENSKQQFRDTLDPRSGEARSFKWYQGNKVLNSSKVNTVYGIRPCLWLKGDTEIEFAPGSTDTNPIYKIKIPEKTGLEEGDILRMGSYKGEPLDYRVMGRRDVNGDGKEELFLAASKIVSFKEINGASNSFVLWKMNNKQNVTHIRRWLNATEESINYSANSDTSPSYKDQAGFLAESNGVKPYEYNAIVPVTHRSITNMQEVSGSVWAPDGGSADFIYDTSKAWPSTFTNTTMDTAYYHETEDRVFLPSMQDIYDFFGGADLAKVDANMSVGATDAAKAEAADADMYNYSELFLRDTVRTNALSKHNRFYLWKKGGNLVNTITATSKYGIMPCMFIKSDVPIELAAGSTTANPVYAISKVPYKKMELGDIIRIGSYKGEPVEYRVMGSRDVDGDGMEEAFVAANKIVSYKEINGATNSFVLWKMNNKQNVTHIRRWLNATDESISYTGGGDTAPSYKDQAGFLAASNGVKPYEYNAIVPVTHRSITNLLETSGSVWAPDGGSVDYIYDTSKAWPSDFTSTTMDTAYYHECEDRVFLPSMQDIYDFFGGTDLTTVDKNLSVDSLEVAKAEAGDADLYNYSELFLRDTVRTSALSKHNRFYVWVKGGTMVNTVRATSKYGILPCMYLKGTTLLEESGDPGVYVISKGETTLGYGRTTKGTVVRATIFNNSDEERTYMMLFSGYTDNKQTLDSCKIYEITVGAGENAILDSDVIPCGDEEHEYYAYLWYKPTMEPVTNVFPVDVEL